MDKTAIALFLVAQAAELLAKGRELWAAQGLDPDAYDATVTAAREAREKKIGAQQAAELKAMGGK